MPVPTDIVDTPREFVAYEGRSSLSASPLSDGTILIEIDTRNETAFLSLTKDQAKALAHKLAEFSQP